MTSTSATNAALVISLCTVLTPFLEFGLQRRIPPAGIVFGATIAVIGVAVLGGGVTKLGGGDLLVFSAACLRSVMVVSTKRLMNGRGISSAALTALQAATVTGLALATFLMNSGAAPLMIRGSLQFWTSVMFLSLFCTVAAFYVQNSAVRRTSPSRVSLLMGTEPLFGFLFAWTLLGEPATWITMAGAALIVGGTSTGLAAQRRTASN
jgi:drug/metabolite transporter (DMT)-like permease